MQEVDNIIRILRETRKALDKDNSYKIKLLSDQTIHTAAVYQDNDNVIVAVLVYAIGKIIERENYRELPGWREFYSSLIKNLELAISSLEQANLERFRDSEKNIRLAINRIDSKLKDYIEDIFKKARINKASKIYEHGLSLEKTAELLGSDLWDLSTYIGQSSYTGEVSESLDIKRRIKLAEGMFEK
jgi:hypothetical protein